MHGSGRDNVAGTITLRFFEAGELVINLKTAKQIGLTIPPNVLARRIG